MAILRDDLTLTQVFSDILSLITISSCFILKIPQILSIIKVKNTKGINLTGLLMELSSYTITFCYNFRNGYAILSYLEYPIILIQEIILIFCVLFYMNLLNAKSFIGSVIYFAIFSGFMFGVLPREFLAFLIPLCTPVGASSKVVQLVEIIRSKNAESVSLLTWFISVFTNFVALLSTYILEGFNRRRLIERFSLFVHSICMVLCVTYYKIFPEKKLRNWSSDTSFDS